jgi:hypothetical protein
VKPLASALTDVGGVSTSTTPAPQAFGREPPIELDGTQRWIDGVAM